MLDTRETQSPYMILRSCCCLFTSLLLSQSLTSAKSLVFDRNIQKFDISNSGHLAVVTYDNDKDQTQVVVINLADPNSESPSLLLNGHVPYPRFNHDGTILGLGSDKEVRIYDWKNWRKVIPTLTPPRKNEYSIGAGSSFNFSPDGRWLSIFRNDAVELIDLQSGEPRKQAVPPADSHDTVLTLFSPDSHWLLAISQDGVVSLIDVVNARLHEHASLEWALIKDGEDSDAYDARLRSFFAKAARGGDFLDLRWERICHCMAGDPAMSVSQTAFAIFGKFTDAIGFQGDLGPDLDSVWTVFSPEGTHYAMSSEESTELLQTLGGRSTGLHCPGCGVARVSPKGAMLAFFPVPSNLPQTSGVRGVPARLKIVPEIWESSTKRKVAELPVMNLPKDRFFRCMWSPNGRYFVYESDAKILQIWDESSAR